MKSFKVSLVGLKSGMVVDSKNFFSDSRDRVEVKAKHFFGLKYMDFKRYPNFYTLQIEELS